MNIEEQLHHGKELVAFRIANDCAACSDYANIQIDVVYVKCNIARDHKSIGLYDNYHGQKHQYKGLAITCYMDSSWEQPYGWELVIDTAGSTCIPLADAEHLVRTLRPINRKLAAIRKKEGGEASFEDFVFRVARVLGVKAFYGRFGNNVRCQRNETMGDLSNQLRSIIRKNQAALGCKTAV